MEKLTQIAPSPMGQFDPTGTGQFDPTGTGQFGSEKWRSRNNGNAKKINRSYPAEESLCVSENHNNHTSEFHSQIYNF